MKIFIDPGHGGVWRPNPPKGDPGVVTPDGKKIESHYTFLYACTLRDVLEAAGFHVVMTRDHDEYTVDNALRTVGTQRDDLFIALHFDTWSGGKKLIYYAGLVDKHGLHEDSLKLAKALDKHLQTNDIRSSTTSRFGRLYIDDAHCPSVLIEIDRIDRADDSMTARLEFSNLVLQALREHLNIKERPGGEVDSPTKTFNTPFQRVFIIDENNVQKQLTNIDRMSIVGDKLYIALKSEIQ